MNRPRTQSGHEITPLPGLEQFVDRLAPGMELSGRIVDTLGDGVFILRIWGHNILAESSHPFQRFDEIVLHVSSVQPRLIFSIRPANRKGDTGIYA